MRIDKGPERGCIYLLTDRRGGANGAGSRSYSYVFFSVSGEGHMRTDKIPADLQLWIDARRRHKLSDAHVQMARELGLNPRKLGKLDNHGQEAWKLPLPQYIEELYLRRF